VRSTCSNLTGHHERDADDAKLGAHTEQSDEGV
jgi:hypothetical protein